MSSKETRVWIFDISELLTVKPGGAAETFFEKIAERLTWCTALKDQAGIIKDLADSKDVEEVYGLGEAGLFDEFFCFLSHFRIQDLLMKLKPEIKLPPPKDNRSEIWLECNILLEYLDKLERLFI